MLNVEVSDYFRSLPKITQESIRQSGLYFEDEDELQAFVSNLNEE